MKEPLEKDITMQVFSEAWMHEYARLWNAEQAMVRELIRQRFNAVIGYGFLDQRKPHGILRVAHGIAKQANHYDDCELNWDLRAAPSDWAQWLGQGFNLSNLLVAVGTQRLQVWKGDHRQILRKPPLVNALLRAFALMTQVRVGELLTHDD
ncbi:MAG: SCP-2 sterol transfer family protein [Candidatus Competibacteraceae bacterium]|nr:SCP-2 sterol transfer family protein [Candidatus Competibacteraceae bacterium]